MDNATNYEQWSAAAEMLDIQEGMFTALLHLNEAIV